MTSARGETIGYEKLIVVIGSRPVVPPISGVELGNVLSIKKDLDYLACTTAITASDWLV